MYQLNIPFNEDPLDDIRKIKRFREVPESGIMCELLWSDPSSINGRRPSNRGVAITFGPDVVKNFLKIKILMGGFNSQFHSTLIFVL